MRSVACTLGALAACSSLGPDPCTEQGIPGTCDIAGGSAMIAIADYEFSFASSDCGIDAHQGSNYAQDPSELTIGFGFRDAARDADVTLTCGPIARATLIAATHAVPLEMLCTPKLIVRGPVVDPQLYGACCGNLTATVPAGTLTVTSNVDGKGNGPMSMQLDIAPADVEGYDAPTNTTHTMHIEANALIASDTFGTAMSPAPSCQFHL